MQLLFLQVSAGGLGAETQVVKSKTIRGGRGDLELRFKVADNVSCWFK